MRSGSFGRYSVNYTDLDLNYDEQYCYTVTYVNGAVESHHSNLACAITEPMPRKIITWPIGMV